ncbi:NUDIX hydrolase [Streptomyces sp. NPDC054796]
MPHSGPPHDEPVPTAHSGGADVTAIAVTLLVTDERGHVLLTAGTTTAAASEDATRGAPTLPGTAVRSTETPQQAAARELASAFGLADVTVGRLVAVDSRTPPPHERPHGHPHDQQPHGRPLALHAHAVGPLTARQLADLRTADCHAARWCTVEEAVHRLDPAAGRLLRHGLRALATGRVAYLHEGEPQLGSPVGVPPAHRAELESAHALTWADFVAQRPTVWVSVCVLLTDPRGRVLVVEPGYARHWLLPGGGLDSDTGETPREGAARELAEELGLRLDVGRLLAVDWIPHAALPRVAYAYDGGTVEEDVLSRIRLPERELTAWRLVAPEDLDGLLRDHVTARVRACLAARAGEGGGGALELVNGTLPGAAP